MSNDSENPNEHGVRPSPSPVNSARSEKEISEKKTVAGVLGIAVLGGFGVHKFYLGYQKEGIIMLLITLLTCGAAFVPVWIVGIIEGVLYLTKSNAEFDATYLTGRKPWF
ncbi:TM2 domain-containing protein [Luteolibacter pohnpeiensis]|uniref:TM2 domain-containing protein n=1 Tax=Luteolibacter pohnpeiensis TaxID=454153 RepID=A0A934S8X4_9BACT|nr:TM2 domain-containing protein [Luteolibacter pohnpeiensis]MBK1881847.1 TM2 domain-containing protein [Luteolibacter pohnpeiensis]